MTVPLRELGEHMAPARLPEDLWRRGRRQRYRGRIIAVAVVALLGAAAAGAPDLHSGLQPAGDSPGVPRSVDLPYFWQATVDMAPPGPASVLFGGDSLGLVADPFEDEGGKLAVLAPVPAPAMLPARWSAVAQGALFVVCLLVPVVAVVAVLVRMVRASRRRRMTAQRRAVPARPARCAHLLRRPTPPLSRKRERPLAPRQPASLRRCPGSRAGEPC